MYIIIQVITSVFLIIMCKKWFDPEMPTPSKVLATIFGIFLSVIGSMIFFANGPLTNYLYTLTTAIQIVHPIVIFLIYGLQVALGIFTGIKCAKNACSFIPEEDHCSYCNSDVNNYLFIPIILRVVVCVITIFSNSCTLER